MADKPSEGTQKKVPNKKLTIRHTLTSKLRMVKANPFLDLKSVENVDPGPSRRTTLQAGSLPFQKKPFQQEPKKSFTELRQVEKKAPVEAKKLFPIKRLFAPPSNKSAKALPLLRTTKSQSILRKPATASVENQQKQSARARALSYCSRPPVMKKAPLPKPATVDKEKPAPLKSVDSRTATPARPARPTRSAITAKENQLAIPAAHPATKAAKMNRLTTPAKQAKANLPSTPGKPAKENLPPTSAKPAKMNLPTTPPKPAKMNLPTTPPKPAKTNLPTTPAKSAKTNLPITPAKSAKTNLPTTPAKQAKENLPTTPAKSAKTNLPTTPAKQAKENLPTTPAKSAKVYRPATPGVRLASKTHERSLSARAPSKSTASDDDLCVQEGKPYSQHETPKRRTPSKSLLRSASAHNIRKTFAPRMISEEIQEDNQPVTPSVQPILKSLLRSQSARDIRKSNAGNNDGCADETKLYSTIATPRKTVTFFSPFSRHSTSSAMAELNCLKTPPASVLRERLNKWLAKRGKLSYTFSHLRCFGLHSNDITPKAADVKATTNVLNETITLNSTSEDFSSGNTSYVTINMENLEDTPHLPLAASSPEEGNKENMNNEELAGPEALVELRTLIFSGYPRDQCEQWLRALTKVRPSLDDLPEYWECLAALEEARGDFNSAVDCYGRAIVKGADEDKVGDSLDRLWEKFSQLSSSPNLRNRTPSRRALIDPKQIFKSTVIKFALQNKAVKKFSADTGVKIPTYVCTPVRRSTRRSNSSFRSTPTMKCVSSLNELEQDERENMEFHSNSILNPNVK